MVTFTSESVTEGHPDKMCDKISDAILDAALAQDPNARVAAETLSAHHGVIVAGEITTTAKLNYEEIVRETIRETGYTKENGYDPDSVAVEIRLHEQSPEIAQGVDDSADREQGAGDQGFMIGYACDETEELMPLPIVLSHKLTKGLTQLRKEGKLSWLRPDGKALVTVEYNGRGTERKIKRIATVVLAAQHEESIDEKTVREELLQHLIQPVCGEWIDAKTKIFVNGTGSFVVGGPVADAGLTGRKIIVDTYGGRGRHGGGAFSGKDATKVDRSGAYMARYVAKHVVAANLAHECEVRISYCIGVAEPVEIDVQTFGSGKIPDENIAERVSKVFSFRPKAIIEQLGLRRAIFLRTAAYGHFGRKPTTDGGFSWEKTDKVSELQ
ncbi:methionine adenosyltransferase [Candidatus Woesearchaeota archaeon]|nr:methionine adenosyltransferase [Candidatus Woesearchaeota archaeon]